MLTNKHDQIVIEITRQLHPEDLGKETSELEEIIYKSLEKFNVEK